MKKKNIYIETETRQQVRCSFLMSCLLLFIGYPIFIIVFSPGMFFFIVSFPLVLFIFVQTYCAHLYQPEQTRRKRTSSIPLTGKTALIMPCYNESPAIVEQALQRLLRQSPLLDEIYFVDDGSFNLSAYRKAQEIRKKSYKKSGLANVVNEEFVPGKEEEHTPELIVHRFKENKGKRQVQAWVLQQTDADFIITVDADGIIRSKAIEALLAPFADPSVMAVSGRIDVLNRDENLLTKVLVLHYDHLFRVECAAPSVTGNILYCSGPLSCYRREVFLQNLQAYTGQSFLGRRVDVGDDRHLTLYANRMGKTVYQSTARCKTEVPATIKTFCTQQLRWSRSFILESMLAVKNYMSFNRTLLLWTMGELMVSFLLLGGFLVDAVLNPTSLHNVLFVYLVFVLLLSYSRNIFYFFKKPLHYFLFSPLQGMIQFGIVYPLRLYALFSLHRLKW